MRLPRWLLLWLVTPLVLLGLPYLYSLAVMHSNPSSSLEARGIGVLLVAAVVSGLGELVAVPIALVLLWREARYRTPGNVLIVAAGFLPPVALGLFAFVLMYGHG